MGGYDYGKVSVRKVTAAVHSALERGVNLFDVADVYGLGRAEELLGRAIKGRAPDAIIATKFGVRWNESGRTWRDTSATWVVQAVEGSLRRLQLECIPLYQIHWPASGTPIQDTMEALVRLQECGKVRSLGCCNFTFSLVEKAQAVGRLESIQLPYSLVERQFERVIARCQDEYQMGSLVYNPLAQGLLSGKYDRCTSFSHTDIRRRSHLFQGERFEHNLALLIGLKQIAARLDRKPAQVALRWIMDNPAISSAIAGVKSAHQVDENVRAFGWSLSNSDHERLDAVLQM